MNHTKIVSPIGISYFGISYEAGGIWEDETERPRGTSHLMEHLMCKTYEHMYPRMRELNISDNAYTADNRVVFYCAGLDENINEISQIMINELYSQKKMWTEKQFETEKSIVLQEYDMYFNQQIAGASLNFARKYYGYCDPIGIRSDIEKFTYKDSIEAAEKYFKNPNMIVEVLSESNTGVAVPSGMEFTNNPLRGDIKFGDYDIELENVPKLDQTVYALIGKETYKTSEIGSKLALVTGCLSAGLESPLFQEIREKRGLVYGIHSRPTTMGSIIVPNFFAETNNETEEELSSAMEEFFSRDMKDVISEERFNICKNGKINAKKTAERLPHEGVLATVLSDYNPFEGLEDFNYEDAIELASEVFKFDNFHVAKH